MKFIFFITILFQINYLLTADYQNEKLKLNYQIMSKALINNNAKIFAEKIFENHSILNLGDSLVRLTIYPSQEKFYQEVRDLLNHHNIKCEFDIIEEPNGFDWKLEQEKFKKYIKLNLALKEAVLKNSNRRISKWVNRGADVNFRFEKNKTLLMIAISKGCKKSVYKLLLQKNINVDAINEDGITALHYAAYSASTKRDRNSKIILKKVLGRCLVNVRSNKGWTPLHVASAYGGLWTVQKLLNKFANYKLKTNDGQTALDLAKEYGHEEVAKCLLSYAKELETVV